MDRKTFISQCTKACFFLGLTGLSLEGCSASNYFAKHTLSDKKLTIQKSEFIFFKNEKSIFRKFVLIKVEKLAFPICLYRITDSTYTALWMECTHNSCELHPQDQFLVCPCHGSEFSNKGVVQNPPAELNLKNFQTTNDESNIYIYL